MERKFKVMGLQYPHLFAPLKVRGALFRNRIFDSPEGFYNVGPECFPNAACAAFFERKALGGAASVCLGDCIVDRDTGTHYPFLMRIDDPNSLPGFAALAGASNPVRFLHTGLCYVCNGASGAGRGTYKRSYQKTHVR